MDGIPALDLWDLVVEVLHSSSNQPKKSKKNVQGKLPHDTPARKQTKNKVQTPNHYNDRELCNVDFCFFKREVFSIRCDALQFLKIMKHNREKGLFLSVYVDDIKLAGKKKT